MHIVINIIVTLALLYWPIVMMMSPMMFAAPGSDDDKGTVFTVVLFMSYPVIIFLLLGLLGARYFGVNSLVLAFVSAVVVFFVLSFFGYTSMISNVIRGIPNGGYGIVGNTVYYNAKPILDADADSFTAFNKEDFQNEFSVGLYAVDNHALYFRGKPLPDVSLDNLIGKVIAYDFYWLNDTQVIKRGEIIEGLDPLTFGDYEGFSYWTYSKTGEKYTLYYEGVPVTLADFSSFKPLTDALAKDKNSLFYDGKPVSIKADIDSFESLAIYGFARDKDSLYYFGGEKPILVRGADPSSFEELGWNYYKDKNTIYYLEGNDVISVIENADEGSFQVLGYVEGQEYDAKDANQYYVGGQIVISR